MTDASTAGFITSHNKLTLSTIKPKQADYYLSTYPNPKSAAEFLTQTLVHPIKNTHGGIERLRGEKHLPPPIYG